jgi:hypothetical protein
MNGGLRLARQPGSGSKIKELADERFAPAREKAPPPMLCFPDIDARRKGDVRSAHENSVVFYTPAGCGIVIVRCLTTAWM